jgi:hypothetical protein
MASVQHVTEYDKRDKGIKVAGTDLLQIIVPFVVDTDYDDGSTIRLCQVPSNFVIVEGAVTSKTDSSSLVADLGIYETAENGGDEIDGDMLFDGKSLNSSATSDIDEIAVADQGKAIWELADDNGSEDYDASTRQVFDVVLTVKTAATSSDETCVLKMLLARKS